MSILARADVERMRDLLEPRAKVVVSPSEYRKLFEIGNRPHSSPEEREGLRRQMLEVLGPGRGEVVVKAERAAGFVDIEVDWSLP